MVKGISYKTNALHVMVLEFGAFGKFLPNEEHSIGQPSRDNGSGFRESSPSELGLLEQILDDRFCLYVADSFENSKIHLIVQELLGCQPLFHQWPYHRLPHEIFLSADTNLQEEKSAHGRC